MCLIRGHILTPKFVTQEDIYLSANQFFVLK